MSLLGIIIDKTRSAERLTKPYGFIEGTTDEQLLKDIGAIVLEKGTWTPKYKGKDVSEFLNWIAEGKLGAPLPNLAKRLLCLKREKLARGIKDAGTADYARAYEKKWIAEIDTIFANAGEKIECVVDFLKDKCEEGGVKPGAPAPALPTATAASVASVASVTPSTAPPPSAKPDGGNNAPPPGPPPSGAADGSVAPSASAPPAEDEPTFDIVIRILTQLFESQLEFSEEQNKISRIITKLETLKDSDTLPELLTEIRSVLDSDAVDKIPRIQTILGIVEPSTPRMNNGPAAAATNTNTVVQANVDELKKVISEVMNVKKRSYGDKIHILQQLIYTSCGEASLLDPLIDHLHKLLATFSTLNQKNSRVMAIEERLSQLTDLISAEALSMETTKKDGALEAQLDALSAQLKELDSRPNSPTTGAISVMEEKALEKTKRRVILQEEIAKIKTLIEASNSGAAKKETFKIGLEEERELLLALINVNTGFDEKLEEIVRQFLTEIKAQLLSLESRNTSFKTITTTCNARAFVYRKWLEEEKLKMAEETVAEKARLMEEHRKEIETIKIEKDAEISDLRRQLDELTRSTTDRIDLLTRERNGSSSELERLRATIAAKTEEARNASSAKNAQADLIARKDAEIKSLTAQLAAASTSRNGNVAERNTRIADLEAQVAAAAAGRNGNVAERNTRIADLEAQVAERDHIVSDLEGRLNREREGWTTLGATRASHIMDLEAQLAAAAAGRNGNVAERNTRIADLETRLAAETAGRIENVAGRNARIASLQTERNAAVATTATERQACQESVGSLVSQVENKDRRIGELEAAAAAAAAARPRSALAGPADAARLRGYGVGRDWAAAHPSASAPSGFDRAARAEAEHINRTERGRTVSRGGGTQKRKQKTARHTRKLRK
jgi:hypothetical protein